MRRKGIIKRRNGRAINRLGLYEMAIASKAVTLRVYGKPEPQARPRGFANAGRMIFWSPKSAWRRHVATLAFLKRPKPPLAGPLRLSLVFYLPRTKSLGKNAIWHYKRPDLDNLEKAVIDGLQDAKWFLDDGQIAAKTTTKYYAATDGKPGVSISLEHC